MRSFKDMHGTEWLLRITFSDAKRLREAGFDVQADLSAKIFGDIYSVGAMLWLVCERQAIGMNPPLTPEDFADRLDGTALESARCALAYAVGDFFPNLAPLTHRQVEFWETSIQQQVAQAIAAPIEALLDTSAEPAVSTGTASHGSSQVSADSIPET